MNKKGFNLQIGIELVLFIILFILIMGFIGSEINGIYHTNYDLTLGENITPQFDSLKQFRTTSFNNTQGQASISDFGIFKLAAAPGIIMSIFNILWSFFDGSFIGILIHSMNIGPYEPYVTIIFQILYVTALIFILIKLVLRIVP